MKNHFFVHYFLAPNDQKIGLENWRNDYNARLNKHHGLKYYSTPTLIYSWAYDKLLYTFFYQGNFLQKIYNYSAIDMVKAVSGRFAR